MNINLPENFSLFKLPEKIEFTLFMIREELKNRKFLSNLEQVGFDSCPCLTDFGSIILSSMGFREPADEVFSFYNKLIEHHCALFDYNDHEGLKDQAFDFYIELEIFKRSRPDLSASAEKT